MGRLAEASLSRLSLNGPRVFLQFLPVSMSEEPELAGSFPSDDWDRETWHYHECAFQFAFSAGRQRDPHSCIEVLFYDKDDMSSAITLAPVLLIDGHSWDNRPRFVKWSWFMPTSITTLEEAREHAKSECVRLIDVVQLHKGDVSTDMSKLTVA